MISILSNTSNQSVLSLAPYIPGRTIESVQREYGLTEVIKLGSNENPLGASPDALRAMQQAMKNTFLYPDPDCYVVRHAVAEYCGVAANQIVMGNGSDNLLDLMGLIFSGPNTEVLMAKYAFANYYITAKLHHATPVVVPAKNWGHDLPTMQAAITPKTRLIFLANPNNPTGTCFSHQELEQFLQHVPESVMVVLDEAYYEFAFDRPDYPNAILLQEKHPNLVITRTFSKAFGLAGARIGFAIAHPDVVDLLNRARLPFTLNTLGQAAAIAALKDKAHVQATVELTRRELKIYESTWQQWGLDYIPSCGNFTTVDLGADSARINQGLLENGVIVRPLRPYDMPNHIRVSVGLAEQNQRAISVLKKLFQF